MTSTHLWERLCPVGSLGEAFLELGDCMSTKTNSLLGVELGCLPKHAANAAHTAQYHVDCKTKDAAW